MISAFQNCSKFVNRTNFGKCVIVLGHPIKGACFIFHRQCLQEFFGIAIAFKSLIELSSFEIQNRVKSSWEFSSFFEFRKLILVLISSRVTELSCSIPIGQPLALFALEAKISIEIILFFKFTIFPFLAYCAMV